jgi:hypothetical protein
MSRKPVVAYRDPSTPDYVQSTLPEWVPSVIVFGVGMVLFGVIEILIHS